MNTPAAHGTEILHDGASDGHTEVLLLSGVYFNMSE